MVSSLCLLQVTGLLEFIDCNKELGYGNLLPGASFTGCLYLWIIAATYVDDNAHAYKVTTCQRVGGVLG